MLFQRSQRRTEAEAAAAGAAASGFESPFVGSAGGLCGSAAVVLTVLVLVVRCSTGVQGDGSAFQHDEQILLKTREQCLQVAQQQAHK